MRLVTYSMLVSWCDVQVREFVLQHKDRFAHKVLATTHKKKRHILARETS